MYKTSEITSFKAVAMLPHSDSHPILVFSTGPLQLLDV